ncbi:MAG: acyltransferase domain-containing protein [Frankia sp.]
MGRDLYVAFPAYAAALDAVCAVADEQLGCSLKHVLWFGEADVLNQTRFTQVCLFATEVASFRLMESFGLRPDLVAGHSVGEIAAAHVAGIVSLEDAATFAVARGQLMQELPLGGAMASIQATEDEVRLLLGDGDQVAVAAVNGPTSIVVSGARAAVDDIVAHFRGESRQVRVLAVSHAFHSPLMDPALPGLRAAASGLSFGPPGDIVLVSGLTGRPAEGLDARSPEYWAEHARRPVRFADSLASLYDLGARLFSEVGRGRTLTGLARHALPERGTAFVAGADTERQFVTRLADLQVHGVAPDWRQVFGTGHRRVDLPRYAFQRARHWVDALPPAELPTAAPVGLRALSESDRAKAVAGLLATATARVGGLALASSVVFDLCFSGPGVFGGWAVELRGQLATATGLDLPATVLFDYPTARQLADHLCGELAGVAGSGVAGSGAAGDDNAAPNDRAGSVVPAGVQDRPAAQAGEQIAIVAMGCRFPGRVRSPAELFDLAERGQDAISNFPINRGWDLASLLGSAAGRSTAAQGGFLHEADEFDPQFFGISPREALAMDPQQRILLEIIWEAFERYGLDLGAVRGESVGTYIGATHQDYGPRLHEGGNGVGGYLLTGSSTSLTSGRIAYVFGLEGPAVTVDTACSSSLVAVHLAVQALRSGECTSAIAGGVAVMSSPGMFVDFSDQHGLAPDGRCKPFSADADGTAWAEGAGVLVLERLSDARRRGHTVLGLVLGSATNQDGASNGLTAPNGLAQEKVIRRALAAAGLSARDVDAVEAHGTGTALGDPIEAGALLAVYGRDRAPAAPLQVGSLKSNIGHTQAAAGVGGVIKMVEAMRAGSLPGTLHVREATTMVDWTRGIALLTERTPWPRVDRPRTAAVSSFGISGTNAHVILQQAPDQSLTSTLDARGPGGADAAWPWVLSAREPATLRRQARQLRIFLEASPSYRPADVAFTLAGRRHFEHRAVLVGQDRADLLGQLAALAEGLPAEGLVEGRPLRGKTAFVFPGQGSQWPGMAGALLHTSPVFRAQLEACEAELSRYVDWSLIALLSGSADAPSLSRVDVVQPALFAIMVSLAALWRSLGVEPDAVIGHSQGEIAAAFVAGAITLEDGIRIVLRRSQLLASMAGTGGMAAVPLGVEEVERQLGKWAGQLDIATVNGPTSVTIAGDPRALEQFTVEARSVGVDVRRVDVDYASHTSAIAPLREELLELLSGVHPRTGNVPLYSTLTADVLDTATMDAGYWCANLRNRVLFEDTTRRLVEAGHTIFVELSPHPVLVSAIHSTAETLSCRVATTGSLRRNQGGLRELLQSVASVYGAGRAVAWRSLLSDSHHTELPTYPFERQRYWLNVSSAGSLPESAENSWDESNPASEPPEPVGLRALAPIEQERFLLELIRRHAALVLGYQDLESLSLEQEFQELGFDSLTGLELRNRLNNAIGVELPAALIAEHPTPTALISHVQSHLRIRETAG